MFTVKVYRFQPNCSPSRERMTVYQARSVEVENTGITLHGFGNSEDEAWVPYPNVEASIGDIEDDWRVSHVIVENAAGKTTEVIRG